MELNSRQNILLVDDLAENILALSSILEDLDLNFIEANSGEEALRKLLKYDVALILLDVQMPGMDGFETARLIRGKQKTKHVPIIFVTAISKERENIFKGYQSGAVDYLPKPIDPDILKSKVNIFLELDRQRTLVNLQNKILEKAKLNTDNILNNINDGVFLLDRDLKIKPEYSQATSKIVEIADLTGINFLSLLENYISSKDFEDLGNYFDVLFKKEISDETLQDLNPCSNIKFSKNGSNDNGNPAKYLSANFKRIYDNNDIDELMITLTDNTKEVLLEEELENAKVQSENQMSSLVGILHVEPSMLQEFLESTEKEISKINHLMREEMEETFAAQSLEIMYRSTHLIKGNAALLDLMYFSEEAHKLEDLIVDLKSKKKKVNKDLVPFSFHLSNLQKAIIDIKNLVDKIKNVYEHFRPKRQYENEVLIRSIQNFINNLSEDLKKEVVFCHEKFDFSLIPYRSRIPVKEVIVQLTRNAMHHGLESPEMRKKLNKSKGGEIRIETSVDKNFVELKFKDDGRGIDIAKLKSIAQKSGKWSEQEIEKWTNSEITSIIFESGISTMDKADAIAGRGVGLDLVKHKVDDIGGKIDVNFKEGASTEFRILIPLENQEL